jgi:hypothetical protein
MAMEDGRTSRGGMKMQKDGKKRRVFGARGGIYRRALTGSSRGDQGARGLARAPVCQLAGSWRGLHPGWLAQSTRGPPGAASKDYGRWSEVRGTMEQLVESEKWLVY